MISEINFGNTQEVKKPQTTQYPPSVYYYPARPLRRDEVNISSPSQRQQQMQRNYPYGGRRFRPNLTTVLAVATSGVMLAFFGGQLFSMVKSSSVQKKLNQKFIENVREMAIQNARKEGKTEEEALQKGIEAVKNCTKNLVERVMECKNPTYQKAAMNELSRGPMMSERIIKDILTLDNLKEVQPSEIDMKKAMDLINNKIIGMDEIKDEIKNFINQQNYCIKNGIKIKKPLVLCLDGPPGTGKTTVSEVLAEALGMHYEKISLAGANGKTVIVGSEPVYVGASKGGIARGQINGGTRRVLYCLDEAEKSASSNHNGKVEDTLLSLFDDQARFTDDNLGVPIDISQSIFILTTNEFEKLSAPLKNRVQKIRINPYGIDTKSKIAKLNLENMLKEYKMGDEVVKVHPEIYKTLAKATKDEGGRETTRNVETLIKSIINEIQKDENKGKVIELTPDFVTKAIS